MDSSSSARLFVGGLPYAADDSDLRTAFSSHGEVTDAKVILDRETGRSRGFGFVTFASAQEAEVAVAAMDGAELGGRRVTVKAAEDRGPRRAPGPGGGPVVEFRGRPPAPRSSGGGYSGRGGPPEPGGIAQDFSAGPPPWQDPESEKGDRRRRSKKRGRDDSWEAAPRPERGGSGRRRRGGFDGDDDW